MSRRPARRAPRPALFALAAAAALAAPGAISAQSLLSAGGLGSPVGSVSSRGFALGGVSVGLFGPDVLPLDPASAADLRAPAATFTVQPGWTDVNTGSGPSDATGTRFPIVGLAYPVGSLGMATLTFGSVFDQRWDVQRERVLDLEGAEDAMVTDEFVSEGGLSALRLGFAHRLAGSLAVGVSVGRHLGSVSRTFTRRFDTLAFGTQVPPFVIGGNWRYSGTTATGGAMIDLGEVLRISGSVTWSGELDADPAEGTDGAPVSFDLPLEYRAGASGVLAQGLTATVGGYYADWSSVAAPDALLGGGGTTSFRVGGGLQWDVLRLFGRVAPLRVGYRRADLPFRFDGDDGLETAFTGGLGLNLRESEGVPLARVDLGVERGDRSAGPVDESFWRASVTLRLAGF